MPTAILDSSKISRSIYSSDISCSAQTARAAFTIQTYWKLLISWNWIMINRGICDEIAGLIVLSENSSWRNASLDPDENPLLFSLQKCGNRGNEFISRSFCAIRCQNMSFSIRKSKKLVFRGAIRSSLRPVLTRAGFRRSESVCNKISDFRFPTAFRSGNRPKIRSKRCRNSQKSENLGSVGNLTDSDVAENRRA